MEIGSFIELQFDKGKEWYTTYKYFGMQIARLNSGRAGIFHALKCLNCDTVYLPYYQCETVRKFLIKKETKIKYYHIDESFLPLIFDEQKPNEAVLIVNYYGVMPTDRMKELAKKYKNVIIDNSQAFFAQPIDFCMNVYSARKFVGTPDGAYVIGKNALYGYDSYKQGYSSDTASFLLQRHEYGCEGKVYQSRMINEQRIDNEDIMKMSVLTQKILDGTNYQYIIDKRKKNFLLAHEFFGEINQLKDFLNNNDYDVPMVYPLLIEEEGIMQRLIDAKHFQGRWWSYLLTETKIDSFEYKLSKFMIPITIDQRYGKEDLERIYRIIRKK